MENGELKRDLIPVLTSQYEMMIGKSFLYNADGFISLFEVLDLINEHLPTVEMIEAFVKKYKRDMVILFNKDRYPELKTPETILLYYYLVHYEAYLRRAWWRSDKELKKLFQVFGYSYGEY